jgi:hypothetical protein
VVASLGLLLLGFMGTMAAPLSTARGAWVCLYGLTLVFLLCLASVLPYRPVRPPRGAASWAALGAVCGLAWACALRSFMAEVAGADSGVEWGLTFGYILLPGAVIGGLLGWAEFLRRTSGGPARHRLAYAPLLFAAVLVPGLFHPASFLEDGIGGGAIGVPVIAMLGGTARVSRTIVRRQDGRTDRHARAPPVQQTPRCGPDAAKVRPVAGKTWPTSPSGL